MILASDDSVQQRLSIAQAIKIKAYSKSLKAKQKYYERGRTKKENQHNRKDNRSNPGVSGSSDCTIPSSSEVRSSYLGGGLRLQDTASTDDEFDDIDGDFGSEAVNSVDSTIPWSPKIGIVPPGEPHGRAEHRLCVAHSTLEQGSNTYEDITRTVNIGTLILS